MSRLERRMGRAVNVVVVVALDGSEYVALNAPGEDFNGTTYRADSIAERPGHVWRCTGDVVIPPHGVARVEVRQILGPDASGEPQEPPA